MLSLPGSSKPSRSSHSTPRTLSSVAEAREADQGADPRAACARTVPYRPAWRTAELGAGPATREWRGGSDAGGGFAETTQETKAVGEEGES